jgi:MFS family permease
VTRSSIETRASWVVASVSLLAMACSFGARSTPALAGSLCWFGVGFGGIVMGRIADRIGVRWTVMFGAAMICVGLAISSLGAPWQLYVGHGLFIGFLGNGGINAPLYVYVSRWFDRRRGSALALISSGTYMAGAVWPPIFERIIAVYGWRQTNVDVWSPRNGDHRPAGRGVPAPAAGFVPRDVRRFRRSQARPRARLAAAPRLFHAVRRRVPVAAYRWLCRRPISSPFARTSASCRPTAPRCSRWCSVSGS